VSTAFSNEGFRWTDTVQNMSCFGTMQYGTLRTGENTENGTVESRRATAAGLNLATAANSAVAPFATDFFAYDAQNRVIRHDVQGAGCSSCTGAGGIGMPTGKGQA